MIHYSHCPVCKSDSIASCLVSKDHTVSHKNFEIWKCSACSFMFTQDVPSQDGIGAYYASESYISHSNTQKGIINKLYHAVRKRTLASKLKFVKAETGMEKGNILDVGCGTGAFLDTMQRAGWQITGLEPDESARSKAKALYHIHALPSHAIFDIPNGNFNAITLWHVLEHVHQLHEYVEKLKGLLHPTGRLFIAVPNYTSLDAAVYKENWAAYDVPRHLYHFSPASMRKLMDMHAFHVEKVKPMWFDSFYVSMLSEQYKSGRGNIARAFLKGVHSNFKTLADNEKCSSLIYVIAKKEL